MILFPPVSMSSIGHSSTTGIHRNLKRPKSLVGTLLPDRIFSASIELREQLHDSPLRHCRFPRWRQPNCARRVPREVVLPSWKGLTISVVPDGVPPQSL